MDLSRPETLDELQDRRWETLALTSVGAFMGPFDGSIVAVALAKMGPALHLSFSASIWVQAAYCLATAVLHAPRPPGQSFGRCLFTWPASSSSPWARCSPA